MNVVELTQNLINIPSLTGAEKEVALFIEQLCTARGWTCEREFISPERWNLYVNWSDVPFVVFTTHLDTVPEYFSSRVEGAFLFGRGACDTKGILASMLCGGIDLAAEGESPAFLFVVGEERESIGAKTAAHSGRRASFLVNGEPTQNILASGHKGVLSYTISATGKTAHSAYPEMGFSAIHLLLEILHEIRTHDWGTHELFGEATTNVGVIQGGIAANVFADSASATVMHRIVDSAAARKEELVQLVQLVHDRALVEFHSVSEPQRLHTVPGYSSQVVSFGTDIPYLKALGVPLMIGPGSIHDAHTAEEKIEIQQLHDAVRIYKDLFHTLKNG